MSKMNKQKNAPVITVEAVDLLAFSEAIRYLLGADAADRIATSPRMSKWRGVVDCNDLPSRPVAYYFFSTSRSAMDDVGYYIGTETYDGRLVMLNREVFGIYGVGLPPLSICRWVVLPSSLDVYKIYHPDESIHYYPPDEDFAYQELDHCVNEALADLPKWEFDGGTRAWTLYSKNGDMVFSLEDDK